MIRWIHTISLLMTATALFAFVALPGCDTGKGAKKDDAAKTKDKDKDKPDHSDHGEVGPHGGPLAEWPPYHGELTVDQAAKTAIVYILDKDAKKAPAEEASRFGKVRLEIPSEKVKIDFTHDAKKSGPEGIAFTGSHEFFAKPAAFKGNLSMVLDEKTKKATPFNDDINFDPKKADVEKKK